MNVGGEIRGGYDLNIYDAGSGKLIKVREMIGHSEIRQATLSKDYVAWIEKDKNKDGMNYYVKNYKTDEIVLEGNNISALAVYENKF